MTSDKPFVREDRPPFGLLDHDVKFFVDSLRAQGYAKRSLCKKRRVAASFACWTRNKRVALDVLDESHLACFLKRSPKRSNERVAVERAALRPFLRQLRAEGRVSARQLPDNPTRADELQQRYGNYLRNERGLAERSIHIYLPFIRDFLTELETRTRTTTLQALDAGIVRDILLDRVRDRSTDYAKLLAAALRSLLRFLHIRGETATDLSLSIPTIRRWSQVGVPAFLTHQEVERVLSTTDRSTPRGRRDHAILLLLARLGMRAGEIVGLELADIRWRTGEVLVHGKGRMVDRLPLLSDVGKALSLYLKKDRGRCSSRRVFVRMIAPRVGLAGPAAIGHIVRAAFVRAKVQRTSRGAAHLFRHSLATRMIRQGASLAEISEVLRHRAQNTTEIYAKVAFETLRGVARPWPGMGGGQ